MTRHLAVLMPAALMAGAALLLSACGQIQANSTGGSSLSSSSPVAAASSSASKAPSPASNTPTQESPQNPAERPKDPGDKSSDLKPVVCGPITDEGGATQTLIAEATPNGTVGCTEAFNVINEFFRTPDHKRPANGLQNTRLPSGWECGTDDGKTNETRCFTTPESKRSGLAFHTKVVSK